MTKFTTTQEKINAVKVLIKSDSPPDEYGNFKCGCAINPKFGTINKICSIHKSVLES